MTRRIMSLLCMVVLVFSVLTSCGSPDNETSESNEAASELMSTPKDAPSETGTIAKAPEQKEVKSAKIYNAVIEDYPIYMMNPYDEQSIELAFFDKEKAIPYISMEKTAELLKAVGECLGYDSDYELELTEEGSKVTLRRETGYPMVVDADEDTISFLDFDAFILPPNSQRLIEMLSRDEINDDGTANLFLHTDYAYERYGKEITLPLYKYDIDIIKTDEGCFIPLQTVSDFLLADSYVNTLFNGKMVLVINYGTLLDENHNLTELGNLYYSVPSRDIPEELAEFSYKELCLMLDNLYGLKALHNIDDFDEFFDDTGLKEDLLSTDPMTFDKAMCDLVSVHLDDLHSAFIAQCNYNTLDGVDYTVGSSTLAFEQYYEKMSYTRDKYWDEYIPFYEEVGNTAYITFDTFEGPYSNADYYNNPPTEDVQDTIGIMLYSFEQITRKGSPVENVVLDLSLNTGGELNAAAFVVGMFLGTGQFSIRNIFTGALTTDYYFVDANLDHKYDERDSLLGYNLYCLESPISFSCGNFVPCAFKNSNMVTVLGKTSGGGTCSVLPMTTATGTVFQLSGHYQMSFVKNGSFYDIDKGAEPDYYISTPEHFYDRELLTDYINGLY